MPEPRLDRWHTLRDLGRIAQVLEHTAYRQMAATLLEARTPGLTAYLDALDRALVGPRAMLAADTVRFLAWAWRHQ